MALAEDAVGKIRREVETGGERSLRLREEPCGEEQAEIIGGQQSMRCDGILESGKDRFWHAGGERGQFQILMRIGKKKIPHCCSRRECMCEKRSFVVSAALPADRYRPNAAL